MLAVMIRTLTEGDFAAAIAVDSAAFGYEQTPEDIDQLALPLLRDAEVIGSFDDDRLVGLGAIQHKLLTFPGGRPSPVAAVTWVGVLPGEQRRGHLRRLMTHQLHGLHDGKAAPVALLTASEGGIYGRFGYGLAAVCAEITVPNAPAFRADVAVQRVREVDHDTARPTLRRVHEQIRTERTGYLSRDERTWAALYSDLPSMRRGAGALRFGLHADGVIAFRIATAWGYSGPAHTLNVLELVAATPVAAASLWHYALNRAMVRQISYLRYGPDETLPDLLVNPRAVQATLRDHLWLRIVDLDRTVPLRSYADAVHVTVAITDNGCPWNAGTWQLALGPDGGTACRTAAPAQLAMDIRELGAVFLGGTRLTRLAAAGLVTGEPAAIDALGRALATSRAPYCPEGF